MARLTPLMVQYFEIKNKYKDCLLFYRLGDFYELFYEDAIVVSQELGLTLTGKNVGQPERAPMCGVPFHSSDTYVARLIEKGYKVAICEQMEDPRLAKGLVKREVIRVVTPGTILDAKALDETKNHYITAVVASKGGFGLAVCDVSCGDFFAAEFTSAGAGNKLLSELGRLNPAELLSNDFFLSLPLAEVLSKRLDLRPTPCADWMFDYAGAQKTLKSHFHVETLDGYGLRDKRLAVQAAGGLLAYLSETQMNGLEHISRLRTYSDRDFMLLDIQTRRNLELCENQRDKGKKGSLLWVLDRTKTPMGARMLRTWVEQPLLEAAAIQRRLDGVEELKDDPFFRDELREDLSRVKDFERIMSRVVYETANGRDLLALKHSIENLPELGRVLKKGKSGYITELQETWDGLENIGALLEKAISEDTPFTVREGGMLKSGFDPDLDILIRAAEEGETWIRELEERERNATGIKNLKVRYNKVFGYYIEVTRSNLELVPEHYIRKQTLAAAERYTTPELNDLAELILGSADKRVDLEYTLFCQIRDAVALEVDRVLQAAGRVAQLDCLCALAETAAACRYVKPTLTTDGSLRIVAGRHPVVEQVQDVVFVPNDTFLDTGDDRLNIITGPNMAGKSTYMRQVALIVLMAQMGRFVPADEALLPVTDRVFTRVGASDDLSAGQSTFMVEMVEVANILNHATQNSLLILDEIGRGTSTFDGLSIAWAVLEYIADEKTLGAKTLFSTHYHELTELEGKLPGVKNYCVTVKEQGEDIIFLRKIVRGGADQSYGVQVARLAGLPQKVLRRAGAIQKRLSAADIARQSKKIAKEAQAAAQEQASQIDLFHAKETPILDELENMDVLAMTPIQAIEALFNLQKKARGL